MKVAHVIHSLGAGGAETVLEHLVPAAADTGVEVVVIGLSDAEDNRTAQRLRALGARVHELHRPRYDPTVVRAVAGLLRSEGVDLVHTHLKHADVVGGAAARLVGLPAVSTLHVIEDPTTAPARLRVRFAAAMRSRLAARTVALSGAQRDWYAVWAPHPERIALVPNGVAEPAPTRSRDEVRAELGVQPHEVLALTVSLMRPEKGHADLLDALSGIPDDVPLVAALAGDGPLLEDVRRRVSADPQLRDRVRVLGFRTDVDDLLAASDLVVHPSRADALPTSVVSAIASGRAVVATDVGGLKDILDGGAGVLVPAGSAAQLRSAVLELVGDPDRRAALGRRGRERYEKEFAAPVWASRLHDLYTQAAGGPVTRGIP